MPAASTAAGFPPVQAAPSEQQRDDGQMTSGAIPLAAATDVPGNGRGGQFWSAMGIGARSAAPAVSRFEVDHILPFRGRWLEREMQRAYPLRPMSPVSGS